MSSEPAIVVSNLQKSYRLYHRPFDRVREALSFSDRRFHTEFHALKGLDFEILVPGYRCLYLFKFRILRSWF